MPSRPWLSHRETTMMSTNRNLSLVSEVKRTGLELVRKRKPRGKVATLNDYAKVDFKPWTRDPGMGEGELIPSDETLRSCGVPCRIAYAILLKTRAELIAMHGKVEIEQIDMMLAD